MYRKLALNAAHASLSQSGGPRTREPAHHAPAAGDPRAYNVDHDKPSISLYISIYMYYIDTIDHNGMATEIRNTLHAILKAHRGAPHISFYQTHASACDEHTSAPLRLRAEPWSVQTAFGILQRQSKHQSAGDRSIASLVPDSQPKSKEFGCDVVKP